MKALLSLILCFIATACSVCAADIPSVTKNQTDVSTKRLSKVETDSDNERMMPIPVETSALSNWEKLKFLVWKNRKSSMVLKKFQLSNDPAETLRSPKMAHLMRLFSANSERQMKLSHHLTQHYGDGVMAEALVQARASEEESTKATATILLQRQLEGYLQRDLSCVKVLEELEIRMIDLDFFDQKLVVLEDYIKLFNAKNSGDETLAKVLASVMGGEDKLIQSLTKAKKYIFGRDKAVEVESSLVEQWKSEKDLTPTILLDRLQIRQSLNNLESLEAVIKYIRYYNGMNPDAKFSLLTWLTKDMDEVVVAVKLVAAKKIDATKNIATVLQEEQFEKWLEVEEPFHAVSKTLKVAHFDDQNVQVLEDFIAFFNKKKAGDETLLKVLTSSMGGEAKLFETLIAAKATRIKALQVEGLLIQKWKGEADLNPEILLGRLGMKQSLENLISLEAVMKYCAFYNDKHPDNKFSLLTWLTKAIDEGVVAEALYKAKRVQATKRIASSLQMEQFESWVASGKSADDIVELLKLKDVESNVFASRKLKILKAYIKFINEKKPQVNPPDLYGVLLKGLGDGKFAIMVSVAIESASVQERQQLNRRLKDLFSQWYDGGVTPSSAREKFFPNLDGNGLNRVELILGKYERFYASGGKRVRFNLNES